MGWKDMGTLVWKCCGFLKSLLGYSGISVDQGTLSSSWIVNVLIGGATHS